MVICLPPSSGGYRLKIGAARVNKVREHVAPVFSGVPRDPGRRVDLDGHHLAYAPTLNDNHRTADASAPTTAILTTMNVRADELVVVGDIRPRNDACRLDRKSVVCDVRGYSV